jgi:hypothetical protein
MSKRTEALLHWVAAVTVFLLGLLAFFPRGVHRISALGAPWSFLLNAAFATLAVFHFCMFFDCARGGRWTFRRAIWLGLLLIFPVVPALVYFMFTRSGSFDSGLAPSGSSPMTEDGTSRSGGVSLLCVLLGWFALSGLAGAWIIIAGRAPGLPAWLGAVAICYGLSAGIACVGLSRRRMWGLGALRVWMGVCGVLLLAFTLEYSSGVFLGGYWGALAFAAVLGLGFLMLDRYLMRRLAPLAGARA